MTNETAATVLPTLSLIGYVSIAMAFVATILAMTAFLMYHRDRNEMLQSLANRGVWIMGSGVLLAMVLLMYSIMSHDFQMNYVYSYSSKALNKFYLFATLWAGQEGTFLLWLLYGSIFSLILIRKTGKERPLVLVTVLAVQAFLLLILLKKNPFVMIWHAHEQAAIGFMPIDGSGLNPLLQNPWMVIHPPTLFIGYSMTVVPFAFAISAMVNNDFHDWLKPVRPWVIINVVILGTGIMMGGYWAYTTLGWGGYWAWDPVENASLVPWLFGVVLLHGILIQSKRKALIRTNFLWAGMSFLAMLWGSYLTRSGVLTDFSVHSFAPSSLSSYLLAFQILFTVGFFVVYFWSLREYKRRGVETVEFGNGFMNRETLIFSGMMAVFFTAFVVLIGTSSPLISGFFTKPTSISPDFYNAMMIPVAMFMFAAIGLAPLLAWKNNGLRNKSVLWKALAGAFVLTVIASFLGLGPLKSIGGGTAIYGPQNGGVIGSDGIQGFVFDYFIQYAPYFLFFLSCFVIAINANVSWVFLKNNLPKAGGYVTHVGLGFMLIGILTSSVYDSSEQIELPRGEFSKSGLGYEVKFVEFLKEPDGRDKVMLEVRTASGATYNAYPRFYYSDYSRAYMVNPDVKASFDRDVYISPISYVPANLANQKVLDLTKQQSGIIDDIKITFNDFSVKMGANRQEVTAKLTALVPVDGDADTDHPHHHEYELTPVLVADRGKMQSSEVEIPGTAYKVIINSVNAASKSLQLGITVPQKSGDTARDVLNIEISEKPFISILWFGTILFIFGSVLATINRRRPLKESGGTA